MSKPKDNSQSKPFYKKAGFWVGAIIALFVLIYIVGPKKSPDESAQTEDKLAGTNLSKNAVENACQDAKYGVNDGYSVIDILNYGFNAYEFAYDEEGNPLIVAEWNGKKKDADEQVNFQCYVSGANDENIKVHYIRAGGNDIWKKESDLNYALYDKDGEPQYPELHDSTTETNSAKNTGKDPKMQIQGTIMIDAFSKWNDVDEVSVHINENAGNTYQGDYLAIISANYNGNTTKLEDTLTNYCNKVATVLEQQKNATISEMMIAWTVPAKSKDVIGKCHYHNDGGVMVYDNESAGILQYK